MKHLYALITALGIEFSLSSYAREHDLGHQQEMKENGDYYADYDYYPGFDYDEH